MVDRHKHKETYNKERASNVNDLSYFFHISDIHLDLLYSKYVSSKSFQLCRNVTKRCEMCTNMSTELEKPVILTDEFANFGRDGCDAPEGLVKSAAKYMQEIVGNLTKSIDFIIVTGDTLFLCLCL